MITLHPGTDDMLFNLMDVPMKLVERLKSVLSEQERVRLRIEERNTGVNIINLNMLQVEKFLTLLSAEERAALGKEPVNSFALQLVSQQLRSVMGATRIDAALPPGLTPPPPAV